MCSGPCNSASTAASRRQDTGSQGRRCYHHKYSLWDSRSTGAMSTTKNARLWHAHSTGHSQRLHEHKSYGVAKTRLQQWAPHVLLARQLTLPVVAKRDENVRLRSPHLVLALTSSFRCEIPTQPTQWTGHPEPPCTHIPVNSRVRC